MSRLPSGTAPAGRSYVAEPTWAANPDFKPHHHSISPVRPGRTTQATAPAPSRKSPIRQHQVADGDPTSQSAASPADAARASNAVMREVSEVPVYSRNPTPQGAASSPSRQAQQVQLQSNKFAEMAFYDQEELSFWQTRCTSLHLYGLQRWLLYDRSKVGRILPLTVSTMGFMTLAHSQIRAWIGQAVSAFKPTVPVVINFGAISPSGCAGARALAQGIQRFALSLESPQGSAVTSVEVLRTALSKFVPVEIRNAKVAVWLHPMPYCAQGITHQYETVADLLDLGIMLAVAKLHTVLKTDTRDILQSMATYQQAVQARTKVTLCMHPSFRGVQPANVP